MNKITVLLLLLISSLLFSLSAFSAGISKNSSIKEEGVSTISKQAPVSGKPEKKEMPFKMEIEKKGSALFVTLDREPVKLELFSFNRRLNVFKGKGKISFDISPYLDRVKNNKITVYAFDTGGIKTKKSFVLTAYMKTIPGKIETTGLKDQGKAAPVKVKNPPVVIERVFLKEGKVQVSLKAGKDFSFSDFKTGEIVFKYGKITKKWPMKAVSTFNQLKTAKSPVIFNTDFSAEGEEKAVVFFMNQGIEGIGTQALLKPVKGVSKRLDASDGMVMRDNVVIPGGIRVDAPADGSRTVGRGTEIPVTFSFVRGFDRLPERVEFKLYRRLSSQPDEILKTVTFGPEDSEGDISETREITLLLPFGLLNDESCAIKARSVNPEQTGQSNFFRVQTPEGSISVYSPGSGDKFPPGVGSSIPVRYSFGSGAEPSSLVIRIAKEIGGYDMELYSGAPMDSHVFPRPPDSWPDGDYRIVVNTDDGRIGYSQPFSLSPYRFYLISPDGGESLRTSNSPWFFRWHAEAAIDRVEAVLLKGGVEMYRWTPHINPPDHLLGDELIISPDQPWHPAGTDYKLRIEGYGPDAAGSTTSLIAADESETFFEVVDDWEPPVPAASCSERSPINIVSPSRSSASAGWKKGSTNYISWCVQDESVFSVDLFLVNPSSGERVGIRMGAPNSYESSLFPGRSGPGGSLDYTVPDLIPAGYYKFHIESTDGRYENETYWGVYINNWLTKGSSPSRGETRSVGETQTILWESGGLSDQTVNITLRHWDGGTYSYPVAGGVPNTGRFDWTLTEDLFPGWAGDRMENVYLKIEIDRYRADSEYFTIIR